MQKWRRHRTNWAVSFRYHIVTMSRRKKHKQKAEPLRPVEEHFAVLSRYSADPRNRLIQYVFIPVFAFAILGLVWMVPFPEIGFLKKHGYDIFLNWGSVFIAIVVYYYLRLAPTLSYVVLLTIGVFSFLIVQLEYVERDGGPAAWLVFLVLLVLSVLALWIGKDREKEKMPFRHFLKLLLIGPIWLWSFVFKRMGWPY